MGQHKSPFMINYLYTYPDQRTKGYAKELLNQIKTDYENSALVMSETAESQIAESSCLLLPVKI